MNKKILLERILPILFFLSLSACGGSGDDGVGGGQVVNLPPVFTSATATEVTETSLSTRYRAVARDPDADVLSYQISGGVDRAAFSIDASSGVLSFVEISDFDNPADADNNNIYHVEIAGEDGRGASARLMLSVTVVDLEEESAGLTLMHAPFTSEQSAHRISNIGVTPEGLLVAYGLIDASEKSLLFSLASGDSNVTVLTPSSAQYARYISSSNTTVYIDNHTLYSRTSMIVAPVNLSGSDIVEHYWLSPDESKVLYVANEVNLSGIDPDTGDYFSRVRNELYMTEITGGNRVNLNSADPNSHIQFKSYESVDAINSYRPQFLPDMSRVVFLVRVENTNTIELHSVNLDGSDQRVLATNVDSSLLGSLLGFVFTISPDSSRVIYVAGADSSRALYSVSVLGGGNTNIGGPIVVGGEVNYGHLQFTAVVSADSRYVVFLASADKAGVNELYRVTLSTGERIKLSNGQNVSIAAPLFLSDGSALVYSAGGVYFVVPIEGGVSTAFTNAMFIYGSAYLTIDDTAIVYMAKVTSNDSRRLYISKLDGSSTLDLSGPMIKSANVAGSPAFMLDPAGGSVVYRADTEFRYSYALYRVNLDASNRVKISNDLLNKESANSKIHHFSGDKFYFSDAPKTRNIRELFVYDSTTGVTAAVSKNWQQYVVEDVNRASYRQSDDGSVQAFIVDGSIFLQSTAIVATSVNSSCRIDLVDDVERIMATPTNFLLDAAGKYFYYTLRVKAQDKWQFFRASTADCLSTRLDNDIAASLVSMKLSPDGATVVFFGEGGVLYAVNSDGSNARLLNDPTMGRVRRVSSGGFSFSPDSSRVIYWLENKATSVVELYSATVDGASNNKINAALVTGGNVYSEGYEFTPQISPDGQWVVYRAQQHSLSWDLYKSRLDGSENTRLNVVDAAVDTHVAITSIQFKISADSSRVVYLAKESESDAHDLYSVDLANTSLPIKLNALPDSGQYNIDIVLTDDSQSIVYMAKESNSIRNELFSASVSGSGRTKLNSNFVEGNWVKNFNVSADGNKVIYHVSEQNSSAVGLYVSNIDGTAKTRLVDPLVLGPANTDSVPRLSNDGRVVFDATIGGVDGIYTMAVTGGDTKLVYAVPDQLNVDEIKVLNNNQISVVGDFRLQGVNELFRFDSK